MKYLIGIDEVGRGPIAGPVAVGAFVVFDKNVLLEFDGVKESKQLSEKNREIWFSKIEQLKDDKVLDFHVSFQSEEIIDSLGISIAIKNALSESLSRLELDPDNSKILLDGGLKAPSIYKNQETIIRGDESEMIIALASICAKVSRDRYMNQISAKYPEYGFDRHKGYGTKSHYDAILRKGISKIHRKSFLKKFLQKTHK